MDLEDLRLIDTIAAAGSFTAAGAQLRMSQPSVSARIAAVERAVGTALFVRERTGARLTPAGQRYLSGTQRALRLLDDAQRAALAETPHPTLNIGLPASYAPALAPKLTAAARAGRLGLSIRSGHSRHLSDQLRDGRLDLAVVTSRATPTGMSSRHLLESAVIAVRHPESRSDDQFAVHDFGEGLDSILTELLSHGIPREQLTIVSPATTAVALAVNDNYTAIVPDLAAATELATGQLHRIRLTWLPRLHTELHWLHRTGDSTAAPIRQFIARIRRMK